MANAYGVPEISVGEVARKRTGGSELVLLDVREPVELRYADLGDGVQKVPLSLLARQQLAALPESVKQDKAREIVVFCHHGTRSAQVVAWLRQQGWTNVYNMAGGIDAYATRVDASVGRY